MNQKKERDEFWFLFGLAVVSESYVNASRPTGTAIAAIAAIAASATIG
jgi:hypothetical protein